MSIAVDVALLLPDQVNALALELNRRLEGARPGGLTLGADHLPHITLAQFFVAEGRLDDLRRRVDEAGSGVGPIDLHVSGLHDATETAMLVFEESEPLRALHAAVMEAAREFEVTGDATAFYTGPGELPARDRDVAWVTEYRDQHAYDRYVPHVTVGHGPGAGPVAPSAFRADRLAVCRLARHCTCRVVLHERRL